jgi:tetratricopeptide (TPR) repeat protein
MSLQQSPQRLDGGSPQSERRPEVLLLLVLVTLGAVVRIAHLAVLQDLPTFTLPDVDAAIYHDVARRFAAGDFLLGEHAMRMSPGYQYFLGVIYLGLGDGPWAFRIVQACLGLGTIVLVWHAARLLVGPRWAALPVALAALYGPFLFYETTQLPASLGVFTHALLLALTLRCVLLPQRSAVAWLGVGLCWGVASVVRPNALALVVPLAVAVLVAPALRDRRARARAFALVLTGAACAIAPVTIRNAVASSELVLLTAHGGFNLYVGNGPGASGTYRRVPEAPAAGPGDQFDVMKAVAERQAGRALGDREVDAHWFGKTAATIEADPGGWLALMAKKTWLFWNARELSNNYDYEFVRLVDPVLGLPLPQWGWLSPLALLGCLLMLWSSGAARVVSLFVLAGSAAVILVFVVARYRLPCVVPALLAATWALRAMCEALRGRNARALAVALALLAAGVGLAWPARANKHYDDEYFKLGVGYQELGRLPQAELAYLEALQHNPAHLPTLHNLAMLYERVGARDRAHDAWQRLLERAREQGNAAFRARAARALGVAP